MSPQIFDKQEIYNIICNEINKVNHNEEPNLALVEKAINEYDFDPKMRIDGKSLLDRASEAGAAEICRILIETKKFESCVVEESLQKIILKCIDAERDEFNKLYVVIQLLLQTKLEFKNSFFADYIFRVILENFEAGIKLAESFLEYGVNVNCCDIRDGNNLITSAYTELPRDQALRLIKLLMKYHINPELSETGDGRTPLLVISGEGDLELCKLLVDYGADLTMPNNDNEIPEDYVNQYTNNPEMKFFLGKQMQSQYGDRIASRTDTKDESTISHKNEPIKEQEEFAYEFIKLAQKNDIEAIKNILEKGFDINYIRSFQSEGILHWIGLSKHLSIAEFIIQQGANVNLKNGRGRTPLFFARNAAFVDLLIKHGAALNATDEEGNFPVHFACNKEVAEALVKHGADLNAKNNKSESALYKIIDKTFNEDGQTLVRFLVESGVDLNAKTLIGETVLHKAVRKSKTGILKILLTGKIYINEQDIYGKTALHRAAQKERLDVCELLLQHGADPTIKCKLDKNPLDYAYTKEVRVLLNEAMKNYNKSYPESEEGAGRASGKKSESVDVKRLISGGSSADPSMISSATVFKSTEASSNSSSSYPQAKRSRTEKNEIDKDVHAGAGREPT